MPRRWGSCSGLTLAGTGSETKDKLESRLHDAVCAGRITLADAQHAEASNWLAAWKSNFGVATPTTATPEPTAVAPVTTVKPTTTTVQSATTAKPATTTTAKPTTSTAAPTGIQGTVTPGAFCTPDAATGHTSKGTPVACTTTPSDSRDHWRAA
jgi:hypothetical protein